MKLRREKLRLTLFVLPLLSVFVLLPQAQTKPGESARKTMRKMTQEQASSFARLALKGIQREYPNKPGDVLNSAKGRQISTRGASGVLRLV